MVFIIGLRGCGVLSDFRGALLSDLAYNHFVCDQITEYLSDRPYNITKAGFLGEHGGYYWTRGISYRIGTYTARCADNNSDSRLINGFLLDREQAPNKHDNGRRTLGYRTAFCR